VDPDNIVIVPGGKVTMWNAILMFGEPGAEIMYPNPGFPIYESVIKYSGATAVPIPMLEESVSFFFNFLIPCALLVFVLWVKLRTSTELQLVYVY
jgi:aspartate aminotransferase